ncbi:NAD(P)/FAD-dependent oxidoreductase [Rhizobium sp. 2MFCol3.1]|uniref:flavin-containing monooxygenase n=1 Tax=Rhizobium sp. 2MFCol3.1 TaxID=1246459 RepID=UPI00036C9617|nr:NAD(P)/FAD-dependent oxidoreductase [Rhizobium sp. 2MFCol3.1]
MEVIKRTRVLIVGSGGNGISCAVLLQNGGIDDITIITKHSDFGGCWLQNRYPGCALDGGIMGYQFGYALSPHWGATHASWDEVTAYMQKTAADHGLYEKTDFETELLEAEWLDDENAWKVTTDRGIYLAEFLVPVTGFLEEPVIPTFPGQDDFKGRIFHSSMWPEGYTGEGDRIAVVGAGSSALQIVPALQPLAKQIYMFQRTPNHVIPLNKRDYTAEEREQFHADPSTMVKLRTDMIAFGDDIWTQVLLGQDGAKNAEVQARSLQYLDERVKDPALKDMLRPDHTFGCKRMGASDDFYESLQNDNVELIPEAAASVGPNTIISKSGKSVEVDAIVLATGFVFGGSILHHIKRRDGVTVGEYQDGHPRAYKSVSVAQCPNMFLIGGAGPNGQIWLGLGPGEIVPNYIVHAIRYMDANGIRSMEVKETAELKWKSECDAVLSVGPTVIGGCVNYSQDSKGYNKAAWPGTLGSMSDAMNNLIVEDYDQVKRGVSTEALETIA